MSAVSSTPLWYWNNDGHWDQYDPTTTQQVEAAYQNQDRSVELTHGFFNRRRGQYEVQFDYRKCSARQLNRRTGFRRQVMRHPKMSSPSSNVNSDGDSTMEDVTSSEDFSEHYVSVSHSSLSEMKEEDRTCSTCLCEIEDGEEVVTLSQCPPGHMFHTECISRWLKEKKKCPVCSSRYGIERGTQPDGTMRHYVSDYPCEGYPDCKTIEIVFEFDSGIQGDNHPSPGTPYARDSRAAYLPDNESGREILRLLKIAWDRRLMFTVGRSITRGVDNVIVWNGIHCKTNTGGGSTNHGFPDETYFERVKEELAAKGVV